MNLLKIAGCLIVLNGMLIHGYGQKPVRLPAIKVDSAGPVLKNELHGALRAGKGQLDSLLNAAKSPLQPVTGELRLLEGKPVAFNQMEAEADYSYFRDTAGLGLGVFRNLQGLAGYNISYTMALGGMPFNMAVREANGINTLNYTPFQNFYHFNFDHAAYLETLRNKVLQKVNPEAVLPSALNRVNTIRHNYEQSLQSEVGQLQNEYTRQYKSAITVPSGATNLTANDMTALQNQLLPGSALDKYRTDLLRLQEMSRNKDPKTLASDTNYVKTLGDVKKYETMEDIYGRIVSWKRRFENNPLVKELKSHMPFTPDNFKAYLSDPKNLASVIDDQGGLNTLQRFFYNIKTLDMGQNAVQGDQLAIQNTMNTGVNTEFQNKSTSLGVIYGQNHSINNWQQAGLTSQVTNEYSNLTGFKVGTGSGSPIDQSLSFNFFNFNGAPSTSGQPGAASYLPMAGHKDGVISLHMGMPLGGGHTITLDVSKSFGSFNQNVTGDSSLNKSIAGGSVFNNTGKSNYAAVLAYDGELFSTNIRAFVKTVGLGYNNPGNPLLHSGEREAGLGFSRKFFKQRLSVKYDGDYRHQVFDPSGNYTYTSVSNKAQVGFKIDRNDKVALTYQRSDYTSAFYGQSAMSGVNSRLQLDGTYRFFIGKKKVMNNVTISHQQMSLPVLLGGSYRNNTLLFTNTSSLMLGKNLLSLTILDNQSDNKSYYFNTGMFSSEANYSYALSGSSAIRLASGLGYYANAGWNKQVGIHQQLNAVLKEKLTVDLQLGYRKAVEVIRPELANQLFFSTTMHYTFK